MTVSATTPLYCEALEGKVRCITISYSIHLQKGQFPTFNLTYNSTNGHFGGGDIW